MPVYEASQAAPELMPPKDPTSVLDYVFDWSAELAGDSDTISGTPTVTVESGLTKDSQTNTTTTVTVWLSGGTAGSRYVINCTIVTASGRTHKRSMTVPVSDR